ncbi:MAG: hypothetical protein ACTSUE_03750 [Promethearchaeota archaeon]
MNGRRVHFDPKADEPRVYGSFDSEEEEEYSDDEEWGQVMEHEAAGVFFGRRRRRRRKERGPTMMEEEPILDILVAQGSLIADNVLSAVTPALKGLASAGKRRKREMEDTLRDLVRIKKELTAAREEASHYKILMEECLAREMTRNPTQPTIEQERDLQNAQDAGDDLEREFNDIEQETDTLGSNLLQAIQEEEKTEEDVLKQVSVVMRKQISEQEERVQNGEPPALPPRDIPALPPRDIPDAPSAPAIHPQSEIQSHSESILVSREDAVEIQEVTRNTLLDAFNKTWAETNAILEEETRTEEEKLREEVEQDEWEREFTGTVDSRIETVRASTFPIRARHEADVVKYARLNAMGRKESKESFRVRSTGHFIVDNSAKKTSRKILSMGVNAPSLKKEEEKEKIEEELFW